MEDRNLMFDINNQSIEVKSIFDSSLKENQLASLYLKADAPKVTKQDYLSKLNSMIVEKKSEIIGFRRYQRSFKVKMSI
jgi:hypothetical protein